MALLFTAAATAGMAQNNTRKWFNPEKAGVPVVEGRLWQTDLDQFYDRLPAKAIGVVRPEVMNLARNSAGNYLRFTTDAKSIVVRYQVKGALNMPHMPTMGVSGVDLYALDEKNNWQWVRGRYSFGDTVRFEFAGIDPSVKIREFRLYLPLYNTVSWLELGVNEGQSFQWVEATKEPPILLYGTSILQGGCATRPGLAWTNILGRKINQPLINLGFSGNGRMEKELIDMFAVFPLKMVVLDCMPNLSDTTRYPEAELWKRYQYAVDKIRQHNPDIPIIFTEHCCGYQGMNLDMSQINPYRYGSQLVSKFYNQFKAKGVKNIYLLTDVDINFNTESTIDGTHPNDIGMMQYAVAYEKLIRSILKKEGKRR